MVLPRPLSASIVLALLAGLVLALSGGAEAAVVGPNGEVTGCYKAKGKSKGALRVVPAGKRCRRGERRVILSSRPQTGPSGTGSQGAQGPPGSEGPVDPTLEGRIAQLEAILSGITNNDLLGALANINSLCTQMTTVTSTLNGLGTALSGLGLDLAGLPLPGLALIIPSVPAALPGFSCP